MGKHGSRHQNEVSMQIIEGDIGGLVIDLINMLIRLIKKMLHIGELASGSFWILMAYISHFNHKTLQESPFPGSLFV